MSSQDITDSGYHSVGNDRAETGLATAIATLFLLTMLLSFQPFSGDSVALASEGQGGNAINQIGFMLLGMIAIAGLMTLTDQRVFAFVFDVPWMVVLACLLFAIWVAPDRGAATRAFGLSLIGMILSCAILLLPRSEEQFQKVFTTALGVSLALCYIGLVIFSDRAIHSGDTLEPQHAGLWRGHFQHKNSAGPVLSIYFFYGIYLMRSGKAVLGIVFSIAALIFILNTGSKTTAGLLPVTFFVVFCAQIFHNRWMPIFGAIIAFSTLAALTVGIVLSPTLAEVAKAILSDPTYTGRTTLWQFGLDSIAQKPWTGWGLHSFWGTPVVVDMERPYQYAWDFREIVNGHNSYIDLAIYMGIPAAAIVIWRIYMLPFAHYAKCLAIPANQRLSDFFMMVFVFCLLESLIETFVFQRMDPIWHLMLIALFGLQLTSRLPVSSQRDNLIFTYE